MTSYYSTNFSVCIGSNIGYVLAVWSKYNRLYIVITFTFFTIHNWKNFAICISGNINNVFTVRTKYKSTYLIITHAFLTINDSMIEGKRVQYATGTSDGR